jgi:hypothetical protein
MIGAPLVMILLFSFVFILTQPPAQADPSMKPTASSQPPQSTTGQADGITDAAPQPVVLAPETLPTLSEAPTINENGSLATGAPVVTGTPQAAGNSSAKTSTSPQSAGSTGGRSISPTAPITTHVSLPSYLTNLLGH